MRIGLALCSLLLAAPALSWEARVEDGLCVLDHSAEDAELRVTYDPSQPLYTIALSRPQAWEPGPVFSIQFEGGRALSISTTRHRLDAEGRRLSVSDTGFGNVLDGLQFNDSAVAATGTDQIRVSLEDAEPAVAAFRSCTEAPLA